MPKHRTKPPPDDTPMLWKDPDVSDGRYQARNPQREWTPREEEVLILCLGAAGTEAAMSQTSHWLCHDVLDRPPAYRPSDRPTTDQRCRDSIGLHQQRRWTIVSKNDRKEREINLFGLREGMPITWGEAYSFLDPWVERAFSVNVKPGEPPRIPLVDLNRIMGRIAPEPLRHFVCDLEQRHQNGEPILYPEDFDRPHPAKVPAITNLARDCLVCSDEHYPRTLRRLFQALTTGRVK